MSAIQFSVPSDIFGILGIVSTVLLYQQRTSKGQLWCKLITDSLWIVYYILQNNYSVVAITLVAVFRSIVLMNHEKKWAQGIWWLYIFMAVSIVFSLMAWKDWTSILTLSSSLICIGMYWFRNPKAVRWISVPAAILFLVNVIINQNWLGIISESFLLISSIIGIIRLDLLKQPKTRSEVL